MKNNKKKKSIFIVSSIAVAFVTVTLSSLATFLTAVSAYTLVNLPTKSFSENYGSEHSHSFDFHIIDSSNRVVSIGWGNNTSTPIVAGEVLEVPSSILHEGTTYYVKQVSDAGFRYCDVEEISLPTSILEIGEEAFAYCEKLKSIDIPYQVTEIKKSTFLDCHSLEKVYYGKENGASGHTTINYTIKTIDDHAFDSCINLKTFTCPMAVTTFGESCFQNCKELRKFSFPITDDVTGEGDDSITIGAYAFADCSKLTRIYMEPNINYIYEYAFADCSDSLTIDYTGSSASLLGDGTLANPSKVDAKWRQRYLSANRNNSSTDHGPTGNIIEVLWNTSERRFPDKKYPGLAYTVTTETASYLDCRSDVGDTSTVIVPSGKYATITGFTTPDGDYDNYYDLNNGILEIPEFVKDPGIDDDDDASVPVKIINSSLDLNLSDNSGDAPLSKIIFNSNLMQIRNNAFTDLTSLTALDFSNCMILKEISYEAFKGCSGLEDIKLPYSLEYIGAKAFSGCTDVTDLSFYANNKLFYKDNGGTWEEVTSIVLDQENSINARLFRGYTAPKDVAGSRDGDYYIDVNKNKAYEKSAGAWSELSGVFSSVKDLDDALLDVNDLSSVGYFITRSRLKVISESAFEDLGAVACENSGSANVLLPDSLQDQVADDVDVKYLDEEVQSIENFRQLAIQRYAFNNAKCLAIVQMADMMTDHATTYSTYSCSIGKCAFRGCSNMIRFQASENLYTIAERCFENTGSKFKELLLISTKAKNGAYDYPYAISESTNGAGQSLFTGPDARTDLVIYVKETSSIKNIDKLSGERWNVERGYAFPNYFTFDYDDETVETLESKPIRSHIPTYYNVDWTTGNNILYWKPNAGTGKEFYTRPNTLEDYEDGLIAISKNGSNYTITRYYASNSDDLIDVSQIPVAAYPKANQENELNQTIAAKNISSNLKTIGSSAFATCSSGDRSSSGSRGLYFVLPSPVNKIDERAFYRQAEENYAYGARVVTYRNTSNSKIVNPSGQDYDSDSEFLSYCSAVDNASDETRAGYCCLSNTIENVGKSCFYGHIFGSIKLGTNLANNNNANRVIGTGAFMYCTGGHSTGSQRTSSITATASGWSTTNTNGGLYYTYSSSGTKKILIYQPPIGASNNLTIIDGTNAIGRFAVADTNYATITIPSTVTTLHGGCFQNNRDLTRIIGGTGIKYINAFSGSNYATEWNGGKAFDIFDYQDSLKTEDSAMSGAFKDCVSLTSIDLKSMSSLEKIGKNAFAGCSNITNFSKMETVNGQLVGTSYNYYQYIRSDTPADIEANVVSLETNVRTGVLDLTPTDVRTKGTLKSIDKGAFSDCTNIKYIHLPLTADNYQKESGIKVALDSFPSNNGIRILTGETAQQILPYANSWMHGPNHYPAGWEDSSGDSASNKNQAYYYIDNSYLCAKFEPNDDCGILGSYFVRVPNNNQVGDSVVYKRVLDEGGQLIWKDVTTIPNPNTVVVDPNYPDDPTKNYAGRNIKVVKGGNRPSVDFSASKPNGFSVGDFWLKDLTTSSLYEGLINTSQSGKQIRIVGGIPTETTYNATNDNYSTTNNYNYWTQDPEGNYILFVVSSDTYSTQQRVKEFFYYYQYND